MAGRRIRDFPLGNELPACANPDCPIDRSALLSIAYELNGSAKRAGKGEGKGEGWLTHRGNESWRPLLGLPGAFDDYGVGASGRGMSRLEALPRFRSRLILAGNGSHQRGISVASARRYAESCEMGRFVSSQFPNDLIDPSAHNPPGIAVGQDADTRVGEKLVRECAFCF